MKFVFSDETEVDDTGSISLTCLVTDDADIHLTSFQLYIEGQSVYQEAKAAAELWIENNPTLVAPYVAPTLEVLKANAKTQIIGILSRLVERVTSKYLPTDPILWPRKEDEARAFIGIAEASQTIADAPIVAADFKLAYPNATEAEFLALVRAEMPIIILKADAFRGIDSFTAKTRINAYPLVEAALTEAALLQIVADVDTDTNAFIAANNL